MRHTMPSRRQSIRSEMTVDPGDQMLEQVFVRGVRIPSMIGKALSGEVIHKKMRRSSDVFDFTVGNAFQSVSRVTFE